ncbi:MAG: Uma2 family endonuclease [Lachnospiraceae bacterium]
MEEGLSFMKEYEHVKTMTLEEYEELPEDVRVELIEGEVFEMISPTQTHQILVGELFALIREYIRKNEGKCRVLMAPFDVRLKADNLHPTNLQPDVMVICDEDKLDGKRCNGAPELVIEVVSPGSVTRDYVTKLGLYKKYGAKEYWIVNPIKEQVVVYHFEEEFHMQTFSFSDKIKVGIYEDLYIDFEEISTLL